MADSRATRPGRTSCGSRRGGRSRRTGRGTPQPVVEDREAGVVELVDQGTSSRASPWLVTGRRPRMTTVSTASTSGPYWTGCTTRRWASRSSKSSSVTVRVGRERPRVDLGLVDGLPQDRRWRPDVGAVDAHHGEVLGDGGDLPPEVVGAERPSPSRSGTEFDVVATRSSTAGQHPAQERDRHQGVGHVVQLELVEAQQAVAANGGDRLVHPDEADHRGQLAEGQVRRRAGRGVPERGDQVGLAHAEAPVEVEARRSARRRATAAQEPPAGRPASGRRRRLDPGQRLGLARVVGVGQERSRSGRRRSDGGGTNRATSSSPSSWDGGRPGARRP